MQWFGQVYFCLRHFGWLKFKQTQRYDHLIQWLFLIYCAIKSILFSYANTLICFIQGCILFYKHFLAMNRNKTRTICLIYKLEKFYDLFSVLSVKNMKYSSCSYWQYNFLFLHKNKSKFWPINIVISCFMFEKKNKRITKALL